MWNIIYKPAQTVHLKKKDNLFVIYTLSTFSKGIKNIYDKY